MLTLVPVKTKSLTWTSNINFSTNRNKVVKLSDGDKVLASNKFVLTEFGSNMYGSGMEEGGQWGDIIYALLHQTQCSRTDRAGCGRHHPGTTVSGNGFCVVGNPNPDFNLGWNNRFDYKALRSPSS